MSSIENLPQRISKKERKYVQYNSVALIRPRSFSGRCLLVEILHKLGVRGYQPNQGLMISILYHLQGVPE